MKVMFKMANKHMCLFGIMSAQGEMSTSDSDESRTVEILSIGFGLFQVDFLW